MKDITIKVGEFEFSAELNNSETAKKILAALPVEGNATLWGEEIYFNVPIHAQEESDARELLEPGELAYWPVGSVFCIFYGPTPVSTDERPRAYSKVNVFGKIIGDISNLKNVKSGAKIIVTQVV